MKLAIISDLHDNEPYLMAFLSWTKENQIKALLVTGDVGSIGSMEVIATFDGPVYFVYGNADLFDPSEIPQGITNLGEYGIIKLDGRTIGLCHEPYKIKELLKEKPYIIFHGHTHTPWIKHEGETLIANPGTLGGVRTPSTFAIWDTKKPVPELIRTDII